MQVGVLTPDDKVRLEACQQLAVIAEELRLARISKATAADQIETILHRLEP